MKKIVVFIITVGFSLTGISQESKINWMTVEAATTAQQKEPRKILIDFYTKWCGPCKLLDKNTFQNAEVADYINTHYYAVKFNAEENDKFKFKGKKFSNPDYNPNRRGRNSQHQFAQYLSVSGYPTIAFLDDDNNLIAPITGYRAPKELELFLKVFATNKYKELTTKKQFEAYAKEFKPKFKG